MAPDLRLKRRLVLYSGGQTDANRRLHEAMSVMLGRRARSLTYVPFSQENGEYFFRRARKRYERHGFRQFRYFPVDAEFTRREMAEALRSDVVYLAGGNTFYFLKHLRASGFLERLHSFVRRGGVLAGLSAGAIIMTPHIYLAGYPPHDGDANEVRLKNIRGLGLVDFEFLPHYTPSVNTAMLRYSRRTKYPVVACPDGSGVAVQGENVQFFGPAFMFYRGRRIKLA